MSTLFLYNGIGVLSLHSWGIFMVLKMTLNNLVNLFSPSLEHFHIHTNAQPGSTTFPFLIFLIASFTTSFSYTMRKLKILLNSLICLFGPSSLEHFHSATFQTLSFSIMWHFPKMSSNLGKTQKVLIQSPHRFWCFF